jgi:hypothetical protein
VLIRKSGAPVLYKSLPRPHRDHLLGIPLQRSARRGTAFAVPIVAGVTTRGPFLGMPRGICFDRLHVMRGSHAGCNYPPQIRRPL